jgi:nitrite reductase/ring-hydroxylating ferredoxin subunit
MKKIRICDLNQLTDPGSRGFTLPRDGDEIEGFVVYKNGFVSAFINSCPHTGAPLNWGPHQFLDWDGKFIQCSLHGAIFRADDGYCVRGPCVGQSLKSIPVLLEEDAIWLNID